MLRLTARLVVLGLALLLGAQPAQPSQPLGSVPPTHVVDRINERATDALLQRIQVAGEEQ